MKRQLVKEYACKNCKTLTTGKICPSCQSTELTPDWMGLVVFYNTDNSEVAKTLNITKPGRYAVRVS